MLPTINDVAPRTTTLRLLLCGIALLVASVAGLAILVPGGTAAPPTGPSGQEPTVDGQPLFASWPGRGQQKPDAAIILTGQTYGLLQPCGCSRPQKGGLERRMQFISTLKAKGWPVAGVDLGDIVPEKAPDKPFHVEHALLRYKTTMNAIREMGYIAVGVGKTEFAIEIDKVLGEYALQKQQPPYILAGNLIGAGLTREKRFPAPPGAKRPLIDQVEMARVGQVSVGVSAVVGKSIVEEVKKENLDPSVDFANNALVLKGVVQDLTAKKSQLNILL
jgi:2',3'-cyclic-nucleotide 2'-phosphodiesterase (5'-nucleotidase family)